MIFTNNNLHIHTDASLNDGAQTVKEAIDKAVEIGAKALALTDHGLCVNWMPWYNYCIEKGVKPILGVEAYITTKGYYSEIDFIDKEVRQHLILLAKNYEGLQAISKFVSECNRHLDSMKKPVATKEMIKEFFGEGSIGYGNVICTTACIAGPIATPLSFNIKLDREIQKIEKRIAKIIEGLPEEFLNALDVVAETDEKIGLLKEEIDKINPVAKKTFKQKTADVKAIADESAKAIAKAELEKEKAETKAAKEKVKLLKEEIKNIKEETGTERKLISQYQSKSKNVKENLRKIKVLQDAKKTEEELIKNASLEMLFYKEIFKENLYAEVQYHGIEAEKFIYPLTAKIAKELNVPLVATNDVHMATKEDAKKRELMQNCAFITTAKEYRPSIVGDSELYFKTGDELADMLREILSEEEVIEAMTNIDIICEKCNLPQVIDEKNGEKCFSLEKHYPNFYNADECLKELATTGHTIVSAPGVDAFEINVDGIKGRYSDFPKELEERLSYELGVISKTGYSSYFLFIADVISKTKQSRENTLEIGPGRGSGVGSIVCYLTNITELDPIENNLLFERFLNPERVSLPKELGIQRELHYS